MSSTVSFLFAWPYCSVASCLLRVSSVASFCQWQNGSPQPHPLCIFARKQARNDAAFKLPCDKRRVVSRLGAAIIAGEVAVGLPPPAPRRARGHSAPTGIGERVKPQRKGLQSVGTINQHGRDVILRPRCESAMMEAAVNEPARMFGVPETSLD